MKNLICIGMLLFFATPVFSELSDSDLQRIREIVKTEVASAEQRLHIEITESEKRLRAEMNTAVTASEKRMKEHLNGKIDEVDTRIDGVEKQITLLAALLIGVMALIVVAIGLPQLITAYKQRGQTQLQTSVEELRTAYAEVLAELKQLRAENEALKQRMLSQSESS